MIDTWAATAPGFVLTENSLYTTEAGPPFSSTLTDRGVLTVSRWYFAAGRARFYRLTSLAPPALPASG